MEMATRRMSASPGCPVPRDVQGTCPGIPGARWQSATCQRRREGHDRSGLRIRRYVQASTLVTHGVKCTRFTLSFTHSRPGYRPRYPVPHSYDVHRTLSLTGQGAGAHSFSYTMVKYMHMLSLNIAMGASWPLAWGGSMPIERS